jgi:hypothetical protein
MHANVTQSLSFLHLEAGQPGAQLFQVPSAQRTSGNAGQTMSNLSTVLSVCSALCILIQFQNRQHCPHEAVEQQVLLTCVVVSHPSPVIGAAA